MAGEKTVVAGFGHNMVIKQDNSVWTTGWNLYGQFGYGSINSASTFIRVVTLSDTVVHDMDTLFLGQLVPVWFFSHHQSFQHRCAARHSQFHATLFQLAFDHVSILRHFDNNDDGVL